MFTANVVSFINGKPSNLGVHVNKVVPGTGYTDIDVSIDISHPFPGMPHYDGYDVRGVFMGDGSGTLGYNSDLVYAVEGSDQYMLPDPDDGYGGPDGYTRWFNLPEFSTGGMALFQYTQGKLASPGFSGTASLNPYKYFTDGLGATGDAPDWLENHPSLNGVFTSGTTNTRNYYLRFPDTKGVKYGYAITANWAGPDPDDHPANAPEAVACTVTDSSNVFYAGPSNKGGKIKLDIGVWDWDSSVNSSGVMEDYIIFIESTVLSAVYQLNTSEMTPTGGSAKYYTYHVEIPADNVNGTDGNEYWVIVEQKGYDYTNDFGVTNLADTDPLAALFRYDLAVSGSGNTSPVINGITDDIEPDGLNTTIDDSVGEVNYIVDYTDPDVGQDHDIAWYIEDASETQPTDPPDALPFDWAPKPEGDYKIWVKVDDGFGAVTGGPYDVTKVSGSGWARTWGGPSDWDEGWDVAIDDSGDVYVSGMFKGTNVDFDPSSTGQDLHSATGGINFDCFVSKFTPSGDFVWARTWGGTNEDWAKSVAVSGSYLYVSGYFRIPATGPAEQVDFNPDPVEEEWKGSNGDRDAFISRFDLDGDFIWVQTWGTANYEWGGEDLAVDSLGNVYSLGWNEGPWRIDLRSYTSAGSLQWSYIWPAGASIVRMEDIALNGSYLYFTGLITGTNIDMDPGSGAAPISTGVGDAIICCFNTSGIFQWVKNWGSGPNEIWAQSVACDPSGNIYIGGTFTGVNVDFDPGPDTEYHSSLDGTGNRDCFLTKFESDGDHLWAKTWGGVGNEDWTKGVATDSSGYAYAVGYYRSATCNLDPDGTDIRTNAGGIDIFLSKFDSTGDYIWGRNLGGTSYDIGTDLGIRGTAIFYTGMFQSYNMDFDPGDGTDYHSPVGSEDIFLSRISTNGSW
jgi:hypothetical protein